MKMSLELIKVTKRSLRNDIHTVTNRTQLSLGFPHYGFLLGETILTEIRHILQQMPVKESTVYFVTKANEPRVLEDTDLVYYDGHHTLVSRDHNSSFRFILKKLVVHYTEKE
jgi:hypothetical protein